MGKRLSVAKPQILVSLGFLIVALVVAWHISGRIVANDMTALAYTGLGFLGCAAILIIFRNWRTGFYIFLTWMIFEDFVRKYMGNGPALFFGKDVLLALIYISFAIAVRRGDEKRFRPPFITFFGVFFWLGFLQVFNFNSPSILYGLLGFKVLFYYVPLMFIGYAIIRSDEDLRKFLVFNIFFAFIVSAVGILQAILGNGFLNPTVLAPELEELGNLEKATLSGQMFNLPDSVFVSSGRYAEYLPIGFLIALGAAGYLLLSTKRSRKLAFAGIGLVGAAALLCGNRGCFGTTIISAVVLSIGFLWGAPWRSGQAHRVGTMIRRTGIVAASCVALLIVLFPSEAGTRLQFYTETMLPTGADYQVGFRTWDYPIQNFLQAFSRPHWVIGNGIGTTALGAQYVEKLTGVPPLRIQVEEGYGTMIVEMGILAPVLWIIWTAALLYYSWKIIRSLRETRYFPVALAIGWYAFVLLFQWTYASLDAYENYVCNIYLWVLVGLLFRLPDLHTSSMYSSILERQTGSRLQSSTALT